MTERRYNDEEVAATPDPQWDGRGTEPLNRRLPCFLRNEHRDHFCDRRRLPTVDEIREFMEKAGR